MPARGRRPGLTPGLPAPLTGEPGRCPAGHGPCRSVSTAAPPISPRAFAPFSPPSARRRRTSSRRCAPSSPTCAARGDQALVELTRKFDRVDLDRGRAARRQRRDRAAAAACDRRALDALDARARPHRGLSPPPAAAGRALHRCARRRARLALDRDRGGRPLCAGRHRGLSVVGADERGPGQGRRRAAHRHGGAGAGRQAQSAGAGGGQARRRRRDLSRRRRAGGGGAGLRHRDDRAGRQDRRPRQRLCRRRQAARVRQGRHRHDRRAVRGADPRRRDRPSRTGSPPISWRRPSTTPARSRS